MKQRRSQKPFLNKELNIESIQKDYDRIKLRMDKKA